MNKIKELREKTGLTQKALSELSGIFIRQIQAYESGEYDVAKMSLKNGIALAKALNVRAENLLEDKENVRNK